MDTHIFLLFFCTLLAGLAILALPKLSPQKLSLFVIFSGCYLFGTLLVEMLPELFSKANHLGVYVGYGLFAGFFFQLLLDLLGNSIVHGHPEEPGKYHQKNTGFSLVAMLCLHAFLEGFVLQENKVTRAWLAIFLHKIPVAFTLSTVIYYKRQSVKHLLLPLLLFSLASPAGSFLYAYAGEHAWFTPSKLIILEAISVGSLLHVATVILFESNPEHRLTKGKIFFILLGCTLSMLEISHT